MGSVPPILKRSNLELEPETHQGHQVLHQGPTSPYRKEKKTITGSIIKSVKPGSHINNSARDECFHDRKKPKNVL